MTTRGNPEICSAGTGGPRRHPNGFVQTALEARPSATPLAAETGIIRGRL
jgi:hypothetical protein